MRPPHGRQAVSALHGRSGGGCAGGVAGSIDRRGLRLLNLLLLGKYCDRTRITGVRGESLSTPRVEALHLEEKGGLVWHGQFL